MGFIEAIFNIFKDRNPYFQFRGHVLSFKEKNRKKNILCTFVRTQNTNDKAINLRIFFQYNKLF